MPRKKKFVPSVSGIGLLCNVKAEGKVRFFKLLQMSRTGN